MSAAERDSVLATQILSTRSFLSSSPPPEALLLFCPVAGGTARTCLHVAIAARDPALVELCLEGADYHALALAQALDKRGRRPLMLAQRIAAESLGTAAEADSAECVRLIQAGAPFSSRCGRTRQILSSSLTTVLNKPSFLQRLSNRAQACLAWLVVWLDASTYVAYGASLLILMVWFWTLRDFVLFVRAPIPKFLLLATGLAGPFGFETLRSPRRAGRSWSEWPTVIEQELVLGVSMWDFMDAGNSEPPAQPDLPLPRLACYGSP